MEWFFNYAFLSICHFLLGAFGFLLIDTIIKSGLFGSNLEVKWIASTNSKYFGFKFGFIYSLLVFFLIYNSSIVYLDGDLDKFLKTINKDITTNVNPSVSDNNVNINIKDSNLAVNNPNVNVPSSVGTAVGQAAGSLGIGASTVAGIRGMTRVGNKMPPATRAIWMGAGGLIGAGVFAAGNYANSSIQNNIQANPNFNSENKGGPFPAKSIIEEGDTIDNIMYFLYFNLFISICILFLFILLLYLYKNNKSIYLYITWVFLILFSYISIYLAYNLFEDIEIIAKIYQRDNSISVVNYNTLDPSRNEIKETKLFLFVNLGFNSCILILLYGLFYLYINSKIINEKWDLLFIKNIFGERFYYYFMKIYTYGSKTNKAWMLFNIIFIFIGSIGSILIGCFLIKYIDLITELYEYYKNK